MVITSFIRLSMLVVCLISMVYPSTRAYGAEPVKIGVLAFRPKPQTLAQWQPLAVVLKQAIPERDFVVEAFDYLELEQALASGQLDFVLTNSGHYVFLKKRSGLSSPLATVIALNKNDQPSPVYGGVIFTRAEQADINTLQDIKGKTVATVALKSFAGFQMQAYELSRRGIRMPQEVKIVATGMPHDKVVEAVLNGQAEVGFVRTAVLEGMVHDGKLDLKQLKILNPQTLPGFTQQLSTQLYPEWPFAAMPQTDENLARHVAAVLFMLGDNTAVTRAMDIHGFTVPADYSTVEELLRELRLPPYDFAPRFTLRDVWSHYRWSILGGLFAIGVISFLGVGLLLMNRRLTAKQLVLVQQQHQLHASEEKFRTVADFTLGWEYWQGPQGEIIYMSPSCEVVTGYSRAEFFADPDLLKHVVHLDDRQKVEAHRHDINNREDGKLDFRVVRRDGAFRFIEHVCHPVWSSDGVFKGRRISNRDITERKQAEKKLQSIEWMISDQRAASLADQHPDTVDQGYGDLTLLNSNGIILASIGKDMLLDMMQEYQNLLETSGSIYEKNGDYALGLFTSRWCRLLDRASRKLCHTDDNVEALNSGEWLCHESCWTGCSKESIAQGVPVDIECNGGIRLYAVPIFVGEEAIGSINFGYGEPPLDPARLKELADLYQVDYEELYHEASSYDSRPPFIIAMAKRRLQTTAKLIGELVARKQSEESRNQLSAIVERSLNEIYLFDAETLRFKHVNMGALKNLQYTLEEIKQLTPVDIKPEVTETSFRAMIQPLLAGEQEILTFETVHRRADGTRYPVEVHLQLMGAGQQRTFLAVIFDITQRKQLEAEKTEFAAKYHQLQKTESLGRMAGAIAHNYNNLLGAVLGNLELCMDAVSAGEQPTTFMIEATKAARRAAEVSGLMLTYLGQTVGERKLLDLSELCSRSLSMLREAMPTEVELEADMPSPGPTIKANAREIQQCLANLVTNAWEALDGGRGIIHLAIKTVSPGDIPVTHRFPLDWQSQDALYACLEVADTGSGIGKDGIDKLFDPFYSTKFAGRGLGLPVILGIAGAHHGCITVESRAERGSIFRVFLPVSG